MPVRDDNPLFTIVLSEFVSAQFDREFAKYPRFQNLWDAIYWRLQHKPDAGTIVPNLDGEYRIAKTASWNPGGLPSLSVLYQIKGTQVHIAALRMNFK